MEEQIYRHLYELEDRHWWFRGRRAVIWSLLRRSEMRPRPRVLDAGCGTGRNLIEFGRLGPAAGVDSSATAVDFCHERGLEGVQRAVLEALPFPDASFDLLLATDVLEHVEEDGRAAAELRRVAAPGARLLVTVPAYGWLWGPHDDTHQHVRRYTKRSLRLMLREAGWAPVAQTYFNSILLAPIALVRTVLRRGVGPGARSDYELSGGALNGVLALPMRFEAWLIGRGARLPAGVSIAMVCRPA